MPGISVAVMIVIAAFAIERISGALLFLLAYVPAWNEFMPDTRLAAGEPERIKLEQRHKLASVLIAGALALFIVWRFKIGVLASLGLQVEFLWDALFTAVVLIAGSDQIRGLIKGGEGARAAPPPPEPIHVTGSLILRDPADAKRIRGE